MTATRAAFLYSPAIERFHYPPECPFITQRAAIARHMLAKMDLLEGPGRTEVAFEPAPREVLERFHTPRYLDAMLRAVGGDLDLEGLGMGFGTPDVPVFREMFDFAALATGGTVRGVELLTGGEAQVAFNPAGGFHHARPEEAAGFCYLNDVGLACLLLAERMGRVLYLDVDVHHGDGVQEFFYRRRDVMTISLHESGTTLYPGTGWPHEVGEGPGRGYSVNVPLPAGTYDAAFLEAFKAVVPPLVEAFDPQVVVLQAGADGLSGDPLAHWTLTNNAYAEVARRVVEFGRPVLATGGGGYHPANTARAWALVWTVLAAAETETETTQAGFGGVMLESTEWAGGLRDRTLVPEAERREAVEAAVRRTIEAVRRHVFPLHGL